MMIKSRYWQLHPLAWFRQRWRRLVAAEAALALAVFTEEAVSMAAVSTAARGFGPGLAFGAIGASYGLYGTHDNGDYGYYGYPLST